VKVSELKGKSAQGVVFIYCNCQTNWLATKENTGQKNAANRRKYIKAHGNHDLVSCTINRKKTKPIEPVEYQPSQEPTDDGAKLGPCNDVCCFEFGIACETCELNPTSDAYLEEEGSDDAGE
jgi:hypothetical protein